MPVFFFLLLGIAVQICSSVESVTTRSPSIDPSDSAGSTRAGWGDKCEEVCSSRQNLVCRNATCICENHHPVFSRNQDKCIAAKYLGEDCDEDPQCSHYDEFAYCRIFTEEFRECDCQEDYEIRDIRGLKPPRICYPGPRITEKDIPTFLGFGLGLSLMSGLICMALKMYARARFVRPRRYANAAIPPPLTVSVSEASFPDHDASAKRTHAASSDSDLLRGLNHNSRLSFVPLRALPQLTTSRTPYLVLKPQRVRQASLPMNTRETYAAFALANNSRGDTEYRPIGIRSASSSRRQSYASQRTGSRRPSAGSVRSFRSQSGLVLPDLHPEPDHYILYMIRGPSNSLASDSTTVTNCESSSPKTPKTAEQILAVLHPMKDHPDGRERAAVGPSHTTSSFRTISSEDVFQEEDEQDVSSDDSSGDVKQLSNQL